MYIKYLVFKLASALLYLHENKIAHNDIKLENIFIALDNEPKLADFGLANTINDQGYPSSYETQVFNWKNRNPSYLPPEVLAFNANDNDKSK